MRQSEREGYTERRRQGEIERDLVAGLSAKELREMIHLPFNKSSLYFTTPARCPAALTSAHSDKIRGPEI